MPIQVGDEVKRVYREGETEKDGLYVVERFSADGTKVILRYLYRGRAAGKAVTVKVVNIKAARPTVGKFKGTFYAV